MLYWENKGAALIFDQAVAGAASAASAYKKVWASYQASYQAVVLVIELK